jgi:hypothetical protein
MLLEESLKMQGKNESIYSLAILIQKYIFLKQNIFDSYESDVSAKFSLI